MSYRFSVENFTETLIELMPIYEQHYAEMQSRLAGEGIAIGPFAPRLDEYFKAANGGYLLQCIARRGNGAAVGYCNIYLTNDMHNHEPIAVEDTIYVLKDHRNGVGRRLAQFTLDNLRALGVKRLQVTAMTDPRAVKLWKRMGFKEAAVTMVYRFDQDQTQ